MLSGVIAPEVVAHLIADDLGVHYDEALNVLRDEAAWEYGRMVDNTPDFVKKADLYMQLLKRKWCGVKLNYYLNFGDGKNLRCL